MYHHQNLYEAIVVLLVVIGFYMVLSWIVELFRWAAYFTVGFFVNPLPEPDGLRRIRRLEEEHVTAHSEGR